MFHYEIYYRDREWAQAAGDPLLGHVFAESKGEAETKAAALAERSAGPGVWAVQRGDEADAHMLQARLAVFVYHAAYNTYPDASIQAKLRLANILRAIAETTLDATFTVHTALATWRAQADQYEAKP